MHMKHVFASSSFQHLQHRFPCFGSKLCQCPWPDLGFLIVFLLTPRSSSDIFGFLLFLTVSTVRFQTFDIIYTSIHFGRLAVGTGKSSGEYDTFLFKKDCLKTLFPDFEFYLQPASGFSRIFGFSAALFFFHVSSVEISLKDKRDQYPRPACFSETFVTLPGTPSIFSL